MSLRTRLIVAYLALAVLPMTAIVMTNYASSLAAYRRAAELENRAEAEQLHARMDDTRSRLDTALERASRGPLAALAGGAGETSAGAEPLPPGALAPELAGLAGVVESWAFVPVAPPDAPTTATLRSETGPAAPVAPALPVAASDAGDAVVLVFETAVPAGDGRGSEPFSVRITAPAPPTDAALRAIAEHGTRLLDELGEEVGDEPELAALRRLSGLDLEQLQGQVEIANTRLRLERVTLAAEQERQRASEAILGRPFQFEVKSGDAVVGHVHARVRAQQLLRSVLGVVRRDEGELPFAVDRDGVVHGLSAEDEAALAEVVRPGADGAPLSAAPGWLVYQSTDPSSGVSFGVARPVAERLQELRAAAARNLAWGLALVAAAGVGFFPLSSRLTRRLEQLTGAARTLADGDLTVRVDDRAGDEIGHLGRAFNHLATELADHQGRLLAGERERREQEIRHRLLAADHERKSAEIEAARQFQLSLLPHSLPDHPAFAIAVSMRTATEVGGDFYDFRLGDDGSLIVTVGDATGHGAAAGTMVTVAKSLFTLEADTGPERFLTAASAAIRGMHLGRMCMAMLLARFRPGSIVFSSAGMPPPLIRRAADGSLEEALLPGTPLGAPLLGGYRDRTLAFAPGDTVLFLTDGAAEQCDASGEPLGYDRLRECFAMNADDSPAAVIAALERCVDRWRGAGALSDDVTFLIIRATDSPAG